jgi:hypothetical protein
LHLCIGQVGGDVHRHGGQSHLLGGFESGMARDDDSVTIDHEGLTKTKLTQRFSHGVHSPIIDAGIAVIGHDRVDLAEFYGKGGGFNGHSAPPSA